MIAWSGFAGFDVLASALRAPPLALAGGSLIFVTFVILLLFAVVFGYYTRRGSDISQTPYRPEDGPPESPSELAHDTTQDVRNWERGTAGSHGRHRPAADREPAERRAATERRQPASQRSLRSPRHCANGGRERARSLISIRRSVRQTTCMATVLAPPSRSTLISPQRRAGAPGSS